MSETKYDVLVVGAGILGISSAYYIKKNNPEKKVLVIERFSSVGQGNTGRSNAMFRNTFSSEDNQLLSDSTISYYLHVQEETGVDLGVELLGYLWLMSSSQLSKSQKFVKRMRANRIETKQYSMDELRSLIPGLVSRHEKSNEESMILGLEDIDGAVFGPRCGRLDPDKLTAFYRDQFLSLGGKVIFNTNVEQLLVDAKSPLGIPGEPLVWQEHEISGVKVRGELNGEIRADTVVVAAGAWNNQLLEPVGLDGHVKAKKRQIFTISARESKELKQLLHLGGFNALGVMPMIILPKSGVHFKGVRTSEEFWVQCEDNINREFIDVPPNDFTNLNAEESYYQSSIYPVLRSYFPQFTNIKPKSMWAGYYSYNTIDFLPFVSKEEDGLILVGGDSGSGIMKGDALGRIVGSLYRDGEDCESLLFGGVPYQVSRLSLKKRRVEREEWVL